MASSQANQWGAMALSFSSVILLTLGVNINKNKKQKDIPFGSHTLLLFCYQTLHKRPQGKDIQHNAGGLPEYRGVGREEGGDPCSGPWV